MSRCDSRERYLVAVDCRDSCDVDVKEIVKLSGWNSEWARESCHATGHVTAHSRACQWSRGFVDAVFRLSMEGG